MSIFLLYQIFCDPYKPVTTPAFPNLTMPDLAILNLNIHQLTVFELTMTDRTMTECGCPTC